MRIAIIDDNTDLAYNIGDFLEVEFDAECFVYSSKSDYLTFLAHANQSQWDYIFVDYNLEEKINGIRLAELIQNDGFSGKLILITGEGGFLIESQIEKILGTNIYIEKGSSLLDDIKDIIDTDQD